MNNARRKAVSDISTSFNDLVDKAGEITGQLEELIARLDDVLSEEQDSLDAFPEGLQNSERGQHISGTVIPELESARDNAESLLATFQNVPSDVEVITESLDTASE